MAVPKRRTSKSKKRLRRGHHTGAGMRTQACPRCGSPKLPHRVCDSCGYYRRQEAGRGRGRLSVIRVALDAMGGDSAPQAEIAGAVAGARGPARRLPDPAGRPPRRDRGGARPPSRTSTGAASRSTRRPTSSAWARSRSQAVRKKPNSSLVVGLALQKRRARPTRSSPPATPARCSPPPPCCSACTTASSAPPSPRCFPPAPSPSWCSTAAPTSTAPPASWSASPTSAPSTCATSWAGPSPVVGLLNVGEEEEKGTAIVREAHQLLKRAPRLNYVGNIEGRDILPGPQQRIPVDVVVCDGFVGNIVLKFYESVGAAVRRSADGADPRRLRAAGDARTSTGCSTTPTYGGAPLLGVKGVSIICHGASSANAIKNAHPGGGPGRRASGLSQHIGGGVRPARDRGARHDPPSLRRGRQRRHGRARPACSPTHDLTRMLDTSDEWIVERTGIRERRIARPEQTVAMLSREASEHRAGARRRDRRRSSTPSCSPPRAPTGCCRPPPATCRRCSAPTTRRRSTSARPAPGSCTRSPWPRG